MKLVEKTWRYGTYLAYEEIEPEFLPTEKGVRVLPAPFYYEKKLYFELKAIYSPGEKKTFPDGGYEVVDVSGGIRSYNLDQVIIHPSVLQHKKMVEKIARKSEKQAKQRERTLKRIARESKPKQGRRGRPALDPAVKAHRENIKTETQERSGGKRGRPPLSDEARAAKAASDTARKARSGGRRGRPRVAK